MIKQVRKLFIRLGDNERLALVKIFVAMIILVCVEVFFLAIFSSSLNYLTDLSEMQRYQVKIIEVFQTVSFWTGISINEAVIIFSSLFLLLKLYISASFTRYQFKQIYKIKSYLQLSKISQSINSGLVSDRNMSEDILISVQHLISYFISPILTIFVETLVIIGMISFVIYWSSPVIILLALMLLPSVLALQLIINKKSKRLSQIRSDMENNISKILSQSQENVPEIYINNFSKNYLSTMTMKISDLNFAYATNIFLNTLPRQVLEVTLLIFILLLVYSYNYTTFGDIVEKSSPALLVPMMLRLVPSAGKLMGSFQNISFSSAVIENFIRDDRDLLTRTYPTNNVGRRLIKVCESFDNGLVIISGESGSGKSTELRNLALFLKNNEMKVTYVGQLPYVHEGDIFENILPNIDNTVSKNTVDRMIDLIGMNGFLLRKDEPIDPNSISGGERIRLGVLRALNCNSEIVLIDEPTNALDKDNAEIVREQMKILSKQKLLIIVTHDHKLLNMNNILVRL